MDITAIDVHMHLNDPKYSPAEQKDILSAMQRSGLMGICSGWDYASSIAAIRIAEQYPFIYATIGLHPGYADGAQIELLSELPKLTENGRIVAIGECGLDKCCQTDWNLQMKALQLQLDMAENFHIPVVLHVRKAHEEMLKILSERKGKIRCMLHGCSASWEQVQRYLALGCMISFGGSVTWANAVKSVRAAKNTPLDRMLLETDSPYIAPEEYRNKLNKPQNVLLVCQRISKIKSISEKEIWQTTTKNALKFFCLESHINHVSIDAVSGEKI